jgi:hypothetical protein
MTWRLLSSTLLFSFTPQMAAFSPTVPLSSERHAIVCRSFHQQLTWQGVRTIRLGWESFRELFLGTARCGFRTKKSYSSWLNIADGALVLGCCCK